MTNKQYVSATLTKFGIDDTQITIILGKSNINAEETVDYKACDIAVYNQLSTIFSVGLKNVTEGGWSEYWNIEAIKLYYKILSNELGLPNVLESVVTDISNRW